MSPEQASLSAVDVDTRADIYSLGALLYELLTGCTLFDKAELKNAGDEAALRMIREKEPQKPSTKIATLAADRATDVSNGRRTDPGTLGKAVRGDLDWIVMKAIEKDRGRRYTSASELSDDLGRYLQDEPVTARPPSTWYGFQKFSRRNKALLATTAAISTLLIVAVILTSVGLVLYRQQARLAEAAASEARLAQEEAETSRETMRKKWFISDMNVAMQAWHEANVGRVIELLGRHDPGDSTGADLRSFDWYYLSRLCERARDAETIGPLAGRARRIAVSPTGNHVAVGFHDGYIGIWDLRTKRELWTLRKPPAGYVEENPRFWQRPCVAFAPGGDKCAFASWDRRRLVIHSLLDGTTQEVTGRDSSIVSVTFSSTGQLAVGRSDGTVDVWNEPYTEPTTFMDHGGAVYGLAFSRDGKRFASGSFDRKIAVRPVNDSHDEQPLWLIGHTRPVWCVDFSPDGKLLASGGKDHTVRLWDLDQGHAVETLTEHFDEVRSLCFSPDGDLLATGSRDNTAIIWDVKTRGVVESLKGHSHNVESIAFWQSSDELKLLTGSADRTLKCWSVKRDDLSHLRLGTWIAGIALTPDSSTLAAWQRRTSEVAVWDLTGRRESRRSIAVGETVWSIAVSQDLIATGGTGAVRLWSLNEPFDEAGVIKPQSQEQISALDFSSDGKFLAAGGSGGHVFVWDTENRKLVFEKSGHSDWVTGVSCSKDGEAIATVGDDGRAIVWETVSGRQLIMITRTDEDLQCAAFSKSGTLLAIGGDDGVTIWKNWDSEPQRLPPLSGHSDVVYSVMFSPDEKTLITGSGDATLRIWDVESSELRLTLSGHTSSVECADLTIDGTLLVSGCRDGSIRLWRAPRNAVNRGP